MPLLHKEKEDALILTLEKLIRHWETEIVEFKEANNDFDKDRIGQYFSAISNEACMRGLRYGWLVFGVRDKDRTVVGSAYRDTAGLDTLKREIAAGTNGGISFLDIYEVYPETESGKKRVIMFQIPSAATGIPTSWKNHYYGRNGESLGALSLEELERIRRQEKYDWSKQIVPGSGIHHLNKEALTIARENYIKKMNRQHITEEVNSMSDEAFLTKMKLMINGELTNAALLLLGNEDYDYLFASAPEASWRVFDSSETIRDYQIFKIPFITVGDRILEKLRNLTYRYMPNQMTLFPAETKQYDSWLLRELMNNCIAHMDYTIGGRIYLNEFEDKLIFSNPGTFLPGSIQPVLEPSYNPPYYRNRLLTETMVRFNMIDTQTMGIRKVFRIQQEKYFPLPDYRFLDGQVKVTVYGKVLDENYTHILFENPDFDLNTVYLIDRVQKHERLAKEEINYLRKLKVIEGKQPNIYVSAHIAESIDSRGEYIKNKGFDDDAYKQWILNYLKKFGKGKKKDFIDLLFNKLPDTMNDKQKEDRVRNLLQILKKEGLIIQDSQNRRSANWIINK